MFWDWLSRPLVRLLEAINDALEWEADEDVDVVRQ
jgi:hypothetical protein